MTVGIIISTCVAFWRAKRAKGDVNALITIVACAFGLGFFSAKILYVIVSYSFTDILSYISKGDFSFLSSGGQVFYGGLIGGIIGTYLGCVIEKKDLGSYLDAIVPCVPLGHAFGRLGCHFAGCCHGFLYDGFFSIDIIVNGISYSLFPVQLLEVFLNILLFIFLVFYTRRKQRKYMVLFTYLSIYAIMRFALEFLRGDIIRGISIGLSTSQWISIILFVVSLIYILVNKVNKVDN
jgi:phosphatidylglycerol:prolipoprotein diacylglycerol transferase